MIVRGRISVPARAVGGAVMHERGYVLAVRRYDRDPGEVARARRMAAETYAAYPSIDRFVVELLVSEAVTNAVLHSDGAEFYVLCYSPSPVDGSVQVEVHDGGRQMPVPRQTLPLDESGRGLMLLDTLAPGWRTESTSMGKSLIFTLEGAKCRA